MSDMNRIILVGRLAKYPELRYTQQGTAICSFTLANNRVFKSNGERKEQVSFFSCVAWGRMGQLIAENVKKGHRIGIEGKLQQRSWKDGEDNWRSSVEVVIENFQFLQAREIEEPVAETPADPPPAFLSLPAGFNPFAEDDIPM